MNKVNNARTDLTHSEDNKNINIIGGQLGDMWNDQVFIERHKQITDLSKDFSEAIDKMFEEKPASVNVDITYTDEEEQHFEYIAEEEEEKELDLNADALIVIHQIESLKISIGHLISSIHPKARKRNRNFTELINGLNQLEKYLDRMKIRAEKILTVAY